MSGSVDVEMIEEAGGEGSSRRPVVLLPPFPLDDIFSDDWEQCSRTLRKLRNVVIGSSRQKNIVYQHNLLPRLICLLSSDSAPLEVAREAAILCNSLAKGTEEQVAHLVQSGILPQLQNCILNPDPKLSEMALCCLRNIFERGAVQPEAVSSYVELVSFLAKVGGRSASSLESAAAIFRRTCRSRSHQAALLGAGVVEMLGPALYAAHSGVELEALSCFASLCAGNREASQALLNASVDGKRLVDRLEFLLGRDKPVRIQLAAAKCLTNLCRAGALSPTDDVIVFKTMPALVRGVREDPLLSSLPLRVDACSTLAYLTRCSSELQKRTAENNQCLHALAQSLACAVEERENVAGLPLEELALFEELEQASLTCLASLALNDEEIRRKVTGEFPIFVESIMRGVCRESSRRNKKLLLAAIRCLHALSRSVEQLRTTFQDRPLWKPLQEIISGSDTQLAASASAVYCNLCSDFSPCREEIVRSGGVELLCDLAKREEESLCLNGVWGLMNLAYGTDDQLKQKIMKCLGSDEVLRQLTEAAPDSPLVLRLLGLLKNCLAQRQQKGRQWTEHIDQLMAGHSSHVIQAVVFVLEGDYCVEAKEVALCILANIAAGDHAKDYIMTNDDVLRKISNYTMHSSPRLQIAATFAISNLVSKEDSGFLERQTRLADLGVYKILQQIPPSSNTTLNERLKHALAQFS